MNRSNISEGKDEMGRTFAMDVNESFGANSRS